MGFTWSPVQVRPARPDNITGLLAELWERSPKKRFRYSPGPQGTGLGGSCLGLLPSARPRPLGPAPPGRSVTCGPLRLSLGEPALAGGFWRPRHLSYLDFGMLRAVHGINLCLNTSSVIVGPHRLAKASRPQPPEQVRPAGSSFCEAGVARSVTLLMRQREALTKPRHPVEY